ncbi:hypothetical protein M2336_003015 [Sphingobium sp. B1D7B]|uniref:phytanoyl-CoA dioxygenase family protein n=1 Tax=unclassified Sphingobium TaxID=2611147 RepID=UPI00222409A5|nr:MULTISPECIES: phytanoyl-CoA dioxygenase family protein [unclassified Sphingobium]MCW2391175.1 hypothetical protein [Sphingobium sp. B11D3A]MCW2406386.1 hypothetical protein [Sphingobium sp. B1D7B]
MTQPAEPFSLTLARDGAEHFHGAASNCLGEICEILSTLPGGQAGLRLRNVAGLRPLLASTGPIGSLAASVLGERCQPVRAILFDKTNETNWSLAWHQDRTICVQRRLEVEGYGPWSTKSGMQHVEPPFALLERMLTLRCHIDDVPEDNAPLLVAPGSHRAGRLPITQYDNVVQKCGVRACLAQAGDVWAYATPILHASAAKKSAGHRRVLQIDYSADELKGGLEWLGI